jgi:phage tail P2-like protein
MSDLLSILPTNRTATEAALEQAIRQGKPDLTPIAKLMNPETCPEEHLGWLAWAFSVDVWSPDWSVAYKREIIATSIKVHRVKGTRGAVVRALSSIGFRTDISEWFEHAGDPHTFRVDAYGDDIFDAGFQINARLLDTVTRLIESVKPVRAHFTLRIGETFQDQAYLRQASSASYVHRLDLEPTARTAEGDATIYARTGHRMIGKSVHEHNPASRIARADVGIVARSGSRHRVTSRITHEFNVREGAAYAV